MQSMITPDEARHCVLKNTSLLQSETISHGQSLGRTLAQDIIAPLNLPPFDNSAMDGYAVRAADVQDATPENPVRLRVLETTAAGAFPEYSIESGTCARIMTGAPIPRGCDAVVMREETREAKNKVEILSSAKTSQNIRRAGSDVEEGEVVLYHGDLVRAAEWGMLASLGCAQMEVGRQPRVGIIVTGDELVAMDAPLQPGQIRDSNSFTLRALVDECGAVVEEIRHVRDEVQVLKNALNELSQSCDAIVSSGGVSMGDFDPVRDVLLPKAHFWKIAMKPGKPVLFATWTQGEYSLPVWGLPGNPVSVMVSFEQFVRPALLKMQGRRALNRPQLQVRIESDLRSPQGKVEFARALVMPHENGWHAILPGDQGSGRLSTMIRANALLVIPADVTSVAAGSTVMAQMTSWPELD
jgi:molybdopterin molybdotransferase